jgi:hypothetical protein
MLHIWEAGIKLVEAIARYGTWEGMVNEKVSTPPSIGEDSLEEAASCEDIAGTFAPHALISPLWTSTFPVIPILVLGMRATVTLYCDFLRRTIVASWDKTAITSDGWLKDGNWSDATCRGEKIFWIHKIKVTQSGINIGMRHFNTMLLPKVSSDIGRPYTNLAMGANQRPEWVN